MLGVDPTLKKKKKAKSQLKCKKFLKNNDTVFLKKKKMNTLSTIAEYFKIIFP